MVRGAKQIHLLFFHLACSEVQVRLFGISQLLEPSRQAERMQGAPQNNLGGGGSSSSVSVWFPDGEAQSATVTASSILWLFLNGGSHNTLEDLQISKPIFHHASVSVPKSSERPIG